MLNFAKTELDIIYSKNKDVSFIASVIEELKNYKLQIEYNCTRFIDQYGSKLDVERPDKFHKFMKLQNEQYASCTRLERVINAYTK